jgi:hypothetical protein
MLVLSEPTKTRTPMKLFPLLSAFVLVLLVSGCTSSYRVVQVPQYGADLYPRSTTRAGVTVAIDEIKAPERVERLFGADLIKKGILPVNVVVSNFGKQHLLLKPSDILLHAGEEVIDPVPVEMVMALAMRERSFLRASTKEEVDKYFEKTTFKETTLYPGETYRGVMFFAVPGWKKRQDRFFTSWSVYRDGAARIRIGFTSLDSGERVMFAPFPITLPENKDGFSY